MNVLAHTPMPFLSVESCHLCLFAGESHSCDVKLIIPSISARLFKESPVLEVSIGARSHTNFFAVTLQYFITHQAL